MANRHFANLGDVWKHLPLAELLARTRPRQFWETHAGSAAYRLTRSQEREYGIYWFLDHVSTHGALETSSYAALLAELDVGRRRASVYPGSSLLAMLELRDRADYLLCDVDPRTIANLREWGLRLGLSDRVRTVEADGITAVSEAAAAYSGDPSDVLVHIDPFDPFAASGASGLSAIDLCLQLIERGFKVAYWYGYDSPEERGWASREARERQVAGLRSVWCGDVMVRVALGGSSAAAKAKIGSVLGGAVGCGVLCARFTPPVYEACAKLGEALETAYRDARLPSGCSGALEFVEFFA